MVLPEFSFCVLFSLVLSKVNLAWMVVRDSFYRLTNTAVEFSKQSLINSSPYFFMEDMFSWMDNNFGNCRRILEIAFFVFLIVALAIYLENLLGISSCFKPPNEPDKQFRFGYRRSNGPAVWKEHYASALGQKQSPINIIISDAMPYPCGPLQWSNFTELPDSMTMHNDGYSITIDGRWRCGRPGLTGPSLSNERYVFNRLYFHWGPTDTEGSEHTLDYERFPLELHLIYLKEGYNTLMDAHYDQCSNGIVIVVFLFEITPVDNPGFLSIITDNLHKVRHPKSCCPIQPFSLNDIYPEFQHGYYKYEGSITQPPCSEIVTYIIQSETIAVSKRQMARFRKLVAFDGKPMMNNSRPVQKLNDRPVYYFTS